MLNQYWQIGSGEGEFRGGDAVMLDFRSNVFMVRVGGDQYRVVRMWLRIIPVQFCRALPDLVTVANDAPRRDCKRELFAHNDAIVAQFQLANQARHIRAG